MAAGVQLLVAAQAQGLPGGTTCTDAQLASIAFGVAASAGQTEGAPFVDGRTASVWDTYAAKPGNIQDGTTPAIGTNFYYMYKTDIALMKSLGVKNFRMSISWSRLIPGGRTGSPVNQKAVTFYNNVFDELIKAGISPAVTLYHWDVPQVLQDSYEAFIDPKIQEDFVYYADQAFKLFGGKVKKWTTFNEPWIVCNLQYGNGDFAPGIKYEDSGRWKCGHNLLLAHAKTYKLYKEKYGSQGGKLGMALWSEWTEPWTSDPNDVRAAQNRMDLDFGWFADPINFGDYPAVLWRTKGSYLQKFTDAEKKLLTKSYDYLGMTIYTSKYGRYNGSPDGVWIMNEDKNGKTIGEQAQSVWLYNVPWSLSRMLEYMDKRYGRPDIWVLENGISEKGEGWETGAAALQDPLRIRYYQGYISEACKSMSKGVRLSHYFAWGWTDNWEWREGYSTNFGLVDIDFKNKDLPRKPKDSARWMAQHIFRKSNRAAIATEG